jgi:hypothetical protein
MKTTTSTSTTQNPVFASVCGTLLPYPQYDPAVYGIDSGNI